MTHDVSASRAAFLAELGDFSRQAVKDLLLPVRHQKGDLRPPEPHPATVYLMRLPDESASAKRAPYILHQLITGTDTQQEGEKPESRAVVRSILCVYCEDGQEGGLMLLNLMERLRIALLKAGTIGERFRLDRGAGLETLLYPDDTAPYFLGELISNWRLPAIEREVRQWL